MIRITSIKPSHFLQNLIISLLFFSIGLDSFAQSRQIIISPEYMGPNALPVPEIRTGEISEDFNLKIAYESHSSPGDKTKNLFTELFIPIVSNKVGLMISVVPIEYFDVNDATLLKRRIMSTDGTGTAGGDIYVGTHIQVFKDHNYIPDVLLNINIKTASGTNLEDARYTDSPGYAFDLSFGKDIMFDSDLLKSIRIYGTGGFNVFQTHRTDFLQNDTYSYGVGFDLNFNKLQFKNALGGYTGHVGDGDRPAVFRSTLGTNFDSMLNYELRFQQGIADGVYTTFRVGVNLDLGYLKKYFIKSN
tara:strand:+ start:1171 stop:2079 length:909 start_codon:yes stop_codon:yes gene_type:complete